MPLAATSRDALLSTWVAEQLSLAPDDIQLTPIASDAGFRRYFRFQQPSLWLAVDAPPLTEDTRQFVALARFFSVHGLSTPQILAADEAQGFLLVEDFGDELIFRNITSSNAQSLYHKAFKPLMDMHRCGDNPSLIPRYDHAMLERELGIFSEWFVSHLLGYSLSAQEQAMLDEVFSGLINNSLEQPQILVHRDFHSRNLIQKTDGDLGIIDFQGALWGACTYDLASLLRDCYLRWPAEEVKHWALEYRQACIEAGILPDDITSTQYLRWFDLMGLQRHIKVLGIFARLHLRDNKPHYLQDLPLVIRYTLEVANSYPELATFTDWFIAKLLPAAQAQAWYCDYKTAGEAQ